MKCKAHGAQNTQTYQVDRQVFEHRATRQIARADTDSVFPKFKPAQAAQPQRVFITGASSGIGLALARFYARQGAILGLAARRRELLDSLVVELQCQAAIYVLDVRDDNALTNAAQDFIQQYGAPDIVIANAGISVGTLTEEHADIAAFKAVFDTNVLGMVSTFQPFIASMAGKGGSLVGIASVAGIRGLPGAGAYSASKAAAINYLESLRVEMQHLNIHVTTIAPGYIKTPMTDVNTHAMPFLMDVDIAAAKFARAIACKKRFIIIPWQMGLVARIMRFIPNVLWDKLMKHAPHKPRNLI